MKFLIKDNGFYLEVLLIVESLKGNHLYLEVIF